MVQGLLQLVTLNIPLQFLIGLISHIDPSPRSQVPTIPDRVSHSGGCGENFWPNQLLFWNSNLAIPGHQCAISTKNGHEFTLLH